MSLTTIASCVFLSRAIKTDGGATRRFHRVVGNVGNPFFHIFHSPVGTEATGLFRVQTVKGNKGSACGAASAVAVWQPRAIPTASNRDGVKLRKDKNKRERKKEKNGENARKCRGKREFRTILEM